MPYTIFRFACVHLTLSHFEGQSQGHVHFEGQSQGHVHFEGQSQGHVHFECQSQGHVHFEGQSQGHVKKVKVKIMYISTTNILEIVIDRKIVTFSIKYEVRY